MADWVHIIWRTLLAILTLFIMTRLVGKRQITQLSFFEYVTGITIGSIAAYVSIDMDTTWYLGLVALGVWVIVSIGYEFLTMKSKAARTIIDGEATVLIKDGKILEENVKKTRLTIDELLQQLRTKGMFKVADVEFAVLETSGSLSVLPRKEAQPITPKHLGEKVANEQEPQTVMIDGNIMDEPLATIGLNREWLMSELDKIGVAPENVFLGQVDDRGGLYVDLYDDQIKTPSPSEPARLLATLKKCEADLELFALTTKNKQAKDLYTTAAKSVQEILRETRPFLE